MDMRQSVSSYIENHSNILEGIMQSTRSKFTKYIEALRISGNYELVGKETAVDVTILYICEVHIHSA